MTHLEQVTDHHIRVWERKWTPPPKGTTQPGAVLANQERANLVREVVDGLLENYTLEPRGAPAVAKVVTVGAAIKQAREARDISQLVLGLMVGRSCSTVCNWERGQRQPSRIDITNLRDVLGPSIPMVGCHCEAK